MSEREGERKREGERGEGENERVKWASGQRTVRETAIELEQLYMEKTFLLPLTSVPPSLPSFLPYLL